MESGIVMSAHSYRDVSRQLSPALLDRYLAQQDLPGQLNRGNLWEKAYNTLSRDEQRPYEDVENLGIITKPSAIRTANEMAQVASGYRVMKSGGLMRNSHELKNWLRNPDYASVLLPLEAVKLLRAVNHSKPTKYHLAAANFNASDPKNRQ